MPAQWKGKLGRMEVDMQGVRKYGSQEVRSLRVVGVSTERVQLLEKQDNS
jgi:hypothetical protein